MQSSLGFLFRLHDGGAGDAKFPRNFRPCLAAFRARFFRKGDKLRLFDDAFFHHTPFTAP